MKRPGIINIAVIDDDLYYVSVIKNVLEENPLIRIVWHCINETDFFVHYQNRVFNLILLDSGKTNLKGLKIMDKIHALDINIPVISFQTTPTLPLYNLYMRQGSNAACRKNR